MKNKLRTILTLIIVTVSLVLLTGCKRSDTTYFLRGVSSSYQITFQEGDNQNFVTSDIILDTEYMGTSVTWESSHPELVSTIGKVNLPDENQKVILKAKFEVDGNFDRKTFELGLVSKNAIDGALFIDANNKIALFSTRNNLNNYLSAKEAFEKLNPEMENYQKLQTEFNNQEQIYLITGLTRELQQLPTTNKFNEINSKIETLPQDIQNNNEYIRTTKSQLTSLQPYLNVGDSVELTINNKTEANYDEAILLVDQMPSSNQSKTSMIGLLNKVKSFLDNQDLLQANTLTQAELESIIIENQKNDLLLESDFQTAKQLYNSNQQRLFQLLPDLGSSYVNSKIDEYEESSSLDNLIVSHLVNNYEGALSDEVKARLAVVLLTKEINQENVDIANQKNQAVVSSEVKQSNQIIIDDYQLVITLDDMLISLENETKQKTNLDEFISSINEVEEKSEALVIDSNISWFDEAMAPYLQFRKVLETADEILTIPLTIDETSQTHPLISKISEAKALNNDQIITQYQLTRNQVLQVIENNTISRLKELKEINELESTEFNRGLFGQMLAQITRKDYEVNQLIVYKDLIDRDQRLSITGPYVTKIILIFLAIVIFLVIHGMTYDYANRKGYEGLGYSLISLIPLGGFLYFYKLPKRRNVSKEGFRQIYRPKEIFAKFIIYAQIVFVAVIVIVPIIYIFGMAFSDLKSDIPSKIWPDKPNFNSFVYLWNETKFTTWWLNTVSIALVNMLVGTVLITGAAYVFARYSFKGKRAGLLGILVLQSFPSFMGLIAMYVLFWKFGLLGHSMALTILYIGGGIPGNIWLIKGYMDQIPKDLDESAMIDGANKIQIFMRIILPLAVPILTFVAVGMFMAPWMDYMLPGYLLNVPRAGAPVDFDITSQWTLAVGLFRFINDATKLNYSAFAAGALIVGLPITVLYMFFQKYLIEGIMAGATKG